MKINKILLIGLLIVLSQISVVYAYTDIAPALDEEKMKAVKEQQGIGVNKPEFDVDAHAKKYKKVTKDGAVMQALELMDTETLSRPSYRAILGNNLTEKPVKKVRAE